MKDSNHAPKHFLNKAGQTEKGKSTAELEGSQSMIYQHFFNQSRDLVCIAGMDGYFKIINPAFTKLLGFSEDELLAKPFTAFIHPDDIKKTETELKLMLEKGESTLNFENRFLGKNGEIFHLEWMSTLDADKEKIYAIARNVSDKKRTEKKLILSEKLLNSAQTMAKLGSWSFELAHQDLYWSEELYNIFEIDKLKTENLYMDYLSRFNEQDLEKLNNAVYSAISEGKSYTLQHAINLSDGRIKWAMCSGIPIMDENNNVFKLEGIVQDITENKKAQDSLCRSEKLLNDAQSIAKLGSWSKDYISTETYWSDELFNIFEIEKKPSQNLYAAYLNTLNEHDKKKMIKCVDDAISQGKTWHVEHLINFEDGREKWVLESGMAIKDDKGNTIKLEGIVQDITEIKKYELTILNNIKEKEILIKELHHRVKNNMQVISSMLSLQAHLISDPKIKTIFNDSQQRIKSMAAVHDLLYRSDNLTQINFSIYIKTLIADLIKLYEGADHNVELKIEMPELFFNLETSISLGLLVNEIITNSLKHALKGDKKSTITFNMQSKNESNFVLIISDNGSGFDTTAASEKETLGLLLINSLVDQLEGTLERKSDSNGTRYTITVK